MGIVWPRVLWQFPLKKKNDEQDTEGACVEAGSLMVLHPEPGLC